LWENKGKFFKRFGCHPSGTCNMGRTLNGFYKQVIKPNTNEWMNEHWFFFFLSFRTKKPCQYILLNISMFIHKERHVALLRLIMKWQKTWEETRCKIKGFDQIH